MAEVKAERMADRALDLKLVTDRQLQDIWTDLGSRNVPTDDFFQACVRRGVLTNYQVELLTAKKRTGYFHGDYKILYMVGAGTFARVFRAAHRETNEIMAVKVLRRRHIGKEYASQFVREGELGLNLRHPNVVAVHLVSPDENAPFLVMDFVEGYTLKEFVRLRRRIDPVEATRVMADIARGLSYAHEQGLAHSDMKMTNVLISSRGQAKLADFGLASSSISDELSAEMIADMDIPNTRTVDYAALERATGVRGDHTRSDLFFLGCIFYNMLTGKWPLPDARDKLHRLSRTRFEEIEPLKDVLSDVPQPVSLIVNRAMMLDPDRRYQTPDKMLADLESLSARMSGKPAASSDGEAESAPAPAPEAYVPEQVLKNLILVDGDVKRQEQLRSALVKVGYSVKATTDPFLAVGKFFENAQAAEGLLINAQDVGDPAINAFNRLANNPKTQEVAIVLLLDEPQRDWEQNAQTSDKRVVLHMPLRMKALREVLDRIVPEPPRT